METLEICYTQRWFETGEPEEIEAAVLEAPAGDQAENAGKKKRKKKDKLSGSKFKNAMHDYDAWFQ